MRCALAAVAGRVGLGPLSRRSFRLFWLGQTASSFGDRMLPVSSTFAVLEIGGSAADIGYVLTASYAPGVLLMLVGGAVADRLSRRAVMIATDAVRACAQATAAALLLSGHATVAALVAVSAVHGAGAAFFLPATTGLVAETAAGDLQRANALMGISRNGAGIVGPAVAGILVAVAGAGAAYAADAGTFVFSLVTLAALRLPGHPRSAGSLARQIAEGWQAVVSRAWVWQSIVFFGVFNLGFSALLVLGPVVMKARGHGPATWGAVLASMSAGSVVGGLAVLRIRAKRLLSNGYLGLSLVAAPLLLLAHTDLTLLVAAAGAAGWAALSIAVAAWLTALQQQVPAHEISRVSAYDWLGSQVLQPVGFMIAAPVASALGTSAALTAAGAILVATSFTIGLAPSIRAVELRPLAEEEPPAPEEPVDRGAAGSIAARTGPPARS